MSGIKVLVVDGDVSARLMEPMMLTTNRHGLSRIEWQILQTKGVQSTGTLRAVRDIAEVEIQKGIGVEQIAVAAVSLPYTEGQNVGCEIQFEDVFKIVRALTRKGVQVILGGPGITLEPKSAMESFKRALGEDAEGIIAVEGEGDLIIQEAIRLTREQLTGDDRFWRIVKGGILPGRMQVLTEEDLAGLRPIPQELIRDGDIEGSNRGCRQECTYCASCHLTQKGIRKFKPENFVDQLEILLDQGRAVSKIHITDNDFLAVGIEWWQEVEKLLDERGLLKGMRFVNMNGMSNAHTVCALKEEDIALLKRLGFKTLGVGIQSFQENVLKAVKRPKVDKDALMRFFKECRENGIDVYIDMIGELPNGESEEEDVKQSFLMSLDTSISYRSLAIIPGSTLHKESYQASSERKISREFVFEYLRLVRLLRMDDETRMKYGQYLNLPQNDTLRIITQLPMITQYLDRIIESIGDNPELRRTFILSEEELIDAMRKTLERERKLVEVWRKQVDSSGEETSEYVNIYALRYLKNREYEIWAQAEMLDIESFLI